VKHQFVPTDVDAISIRQFFNKQDPLVTEWLAYQAHVRAQEMIDAAANTNKNEEDMSSKFSDAVRRANQDITPMLVDKPLQSITADNVNDENTAPLDTQTDSAALQTASSIRGSLPGEHRIYHQVSDIVYDIIAYHKSIKLHNVVHRRYRVYGRQDDENCMLFQCVRCVCYTFV
jgi:hypothetical protein